MHVLSMTIDGDVGGGVTHSLIELDRLAVQLIELVYCDERSMNF